MISLVKQELLNFVNAYIDKRVARLSDNGQ